MNAMDVPKLLLKLTLLMIWDLTSVSSISNSQGSTSEFRQQRQTALSEFLAPPPMPSQQLRSPSNVYPVPHIGSHGEPSRTQPVRAGKFIDQQNIGYLSRIVGWFNPLFYGGSLVPATEIEKYSRYPTPTSSSPSQQQHKLPYSSFISKNCNPCNEVPWIPILNDNGVRMIAHGLYGTPTSNDERYTYRNLDSATSQEVKTPDFSFNQQVSQIHGPLPYPHVYPGPIPPLFRAELFKQPSTEINTQVNNFEQTVSESRPHQNLELIESSATNANFHGHENSKNSEIQSKKSPHDFNNMRTDQDNLESSTSDFQSVTFRDQILKSLTNGVNNDSETINFDHSSKGLLHLSQQKYRENYDGLSSSDSAFQNLHATSGFLISPNGEKINDTTIRYEQSLIADITKKNKNRLKIVPTAISLILKATPHSIEESERVDENSSSIYDTTTVSVFAHVIADSRSNHDEQSRIVDDGIDMYQGSSLTTFPVYTKPKAVLKNETKEEKNHDSQNFENSIILTALGGPVRKLARYDSSNVKSSQHARRNKQVQVIIPYTSEYTPLPFRQSYDSWVGQSLLERTQQRKLSVSNKNVSQSAGTNVELDTVSASQIKVQNDIKEFKLPSFTTPMSVMEYVRKGKTNNTIDVHRLQKNIDNWTIQEYSKRTTISTVQPSSLRPNLLPSKKIPEEYLTTSDPSENTNTVDSNDIARIFSIAGFNFANSELDRLASDHDQSIKVIHQNETVSLKPTSVKSNVLMSNFSTGEDHWKGFSSMSSNQERVYVVTPLPSVIRFKYGNDKESESKNLIGMPISRSKDSIEKKIMTEKGKANFIERAYQVLPQAVNDLVVASTGPESVPLWGIMEHENFASIKPDGSIENIQVEGKFMPVFYSRESKV